MFSFYMGDGSDPWMTVLADGWLFFGVKTGGNECAPRCGSGQGKQPAARSGYQIQTQAPSIQPTTGCGPRGNCRFAILLVRHIAYRSITPSIGRVHRSRPLACFRFWRRHQSKGLYLFQKVAAVNDMVELDRGLAATEIGDELFESISRI